jgi:septal ring factor EnvC (AmiA/AmiB activator)
MQAYELEKLNMKGFCAVLFSAAVTAAVMGSPVVAARRGSVSASGPETTSDVSALRLPDPQKELRHLSKNLKLKRDQRAGVSSILQERTREIRLLLDIEFLSQEYRDTLATKVIKDSDAQIETLLRSKQKRKFDKELARNHETH